MPSLTQGVRIKYCLLSIACLQVSFHSEDPSVNIRASTTAPSAIAGLRAQLEPILIAIDFSP